MMNPLLMSVLAQWQSEMVTATFDSNGGSPTYNSQSGYDSLSVTNPGTPTRSGYTFTGWSPTLPRTITSDTTFIAQWTDVVYTITWKAYNGATLKTENLIYGATSTAPTGTPEDSDWYYYWPQNSVVVTGPQTITETRTELYTITWKAYNGTTLKTDYLIYGETSTAPTGTTDTTQYDYEWPKLSTSVTGNETITETRTELYTITWKAYNGAILKSETLLYGETSTAPTGTSDTTQYDYEWPKLSTSVTGNETITETRTELYTITWKAYNGTTLKTDYLIYGETSTAPTGTTDTTQYDYEWPKLSTSVTGNETITETRTELYTITWKAYNGAILKSETLLYGETSTAPTGTSDTTQYDYEWPKLSTSVTGNETITETRTELYTITWKAYNGAILKSETLLYGETSTAPTGTSDTTQYDYEWPKLSTSVTGNETITETQIAKYTIIWKSYTGATLKTDYLIYGETSAAPTGTPEDSDWYYYWPQNSVVVTGPQTIQEARRQIQRLSSPQGSLTDKFDYLDGASNLGGVMIIGIYNSNNEGVTLNGRILFGSQDMTSQFTHFSDRGYYFFGDGFPPNTGLTDGLSVISGGLMTSEWPYPVTVEVWFEPSSPGYSTSDKLIITVNPETVTATFDSNGGSPTYSSQSGYDSLNVTNPGTPTRSGYTFTGWSPSLPRTITSDTTFVAQWIDVVYTITWKSYTGTTLKTDYLIYGETSTAPTGTSETTQYYYEWPQNSVVVTGNETITETQTTKSYTITWKAYNGAIIDSETLWYGDTAIAPTGTPENAQYEYYWPQDSVVVTGPQTIQEIQDTKWYTISWVAYNGATLDSEKYIYGYTVYAPTGTPDDSTWDYYWPQNSVVVTGPQTIQETRRQIQRLSSPQGSLTDKYDYTEGVNWNGGVMLISLYNSNNEGVTLNGRILFGNQDVTSNFTHFAESDGYFFGDGFPPNTGLTDGLAMISQGLWTSDWPYPVTVEVWFEPSSPSSTYSTSNKLIITVNS